MILLTVEEIIELHDKLICKTGGSHGIRDMGLLESPQFTVQKIHLAMRNSILRRRKNRQD